MRDDLVIGPEEKRVIAVDDFADDSEGVLVDTGDGYGLGLSFVQSLEEAGFVEDGSIKDPWACILAQQNLKGEEAKDPPLQQTTRKMFDFTCHECGETFEKMVRDERELPCKTEGCEGVASRDVPRPLAWAPSAARTEAQLKARSLAHGRHNLKRGISMKQNETQKNTCDEWHSKTRSKKRGTGVIAQHQNDWKDYAEKPATEFRPLGNPVVNDQGRAVYDKERRKL